MKKLNIIFSTLTLALLTSSCVDHKELKPKIQTKSYSKFCDISSMQNCDDEIKVSLTGITCIYDAKNRISLVCEEMLNKKYIEASEQVKRSNHFHQSSIIRDGATLDDYRKQSYDRGHLIPASNAMSVDMDYASFDLVNIVPQNSKLNRGTWKEIEQDVRNYVANTNDDVTIYTGSILDNSHGQPERFLNKRVAIPDKMFKVVISNKTNQSCAVVSDNDEVGKSNVYSVNSVSSMTNLKFSKYDQPICNLKIWNSIK